MSQMPEKHLDKVSAVCGSVFGDGTYQVGTAGALSPWYRDVASWVVSEEFKRTHTELEESTDASPVNAFFDNLDLHNPSMVQSL